MKGTIILEQAVLYILRDGTWRLPDFTCLLYSKTRATPPARRILKGLTWSEYFLEAELFTNILVLFDAMRILSPLFRSDFYICIIYIKKGHDSQQSTERISI
jgi:hypothetical protein